MRSTIYKPRISTKRAQHHRSDSTHLHVSFLDVHGFGAHGVDWAGAETHPDARGDGAELGQAAAAVLSGTDSVLSLHYRLLPLGKWEYAPTRNGCIVLMSLNSSFDSIPHTSYM